MCKFINNRELFRKFYLLKSLNARIGVGIVNFELIVCEKKVRAAM